MVMERSQRKGDYFANQCRFCNARFRSGEAELSVCRDCYYAGKELEEDFASVLEELREVNANAQVYHTGGGCFVLMVPVAETRTVGEWFTRYCYLTGAEDGELPDVLTSTGEKADLSTYRWMVGYYVADGDDKDEEGVEYLGDEKGEGLTIAEVKDYLWARTALESIKDDAVAGRLGEWVPEDGFEGLHDHVDANEYVLDAMLWGLTHGETERYDTVNRVIALVEARLAEVETEVALGRGEAKS